MHYDCIIIGAGPAGLTAAAPLARSGKRVLVLDKNTRPGVKLLLSGGGKGNLTNRHVKYADYVGQNPAFAERALSRLAPETLMAELREAHIPFEERGGGKIFCAVGAKAVLAMLLAKIPARGFRLETGRAVTGVTHRNGAFFASCGGETFTTPRLVLATGSPAWPSCGADGSGLAIAKNLGHAVVPPKPVLVPFVMPDTWPLAGLAGIDAEVAIACDSPETPRFRDALLFTHRGISGPAALQISCYWNKGVALRIDFLPDTSAARLLDAAKGKATPFSTFSPLLPDRLLAALLPPETAKRRVAELSRKQRDAIAQTLHNHRATPARTEGMGKAEAASGGIAVKDVDPMTMQSRLVPGLFFCGEILDITGRLGGYNLHWAFASGLVAGEAGAG